MAREAFLEINCSRYSNRIMEIIKLFDEIGWKYYDSEKKIVYLPINDGNDFNWQKDSLSEGELYELINKKQEIFELIGLNLYYDTSEEGITLLVRSTCEIVIDLNINRRTINNNRESITDIGWYFNNIIQKLQDKGCYVDYIKFEEYTD